MNRAAVLMAIVLLVLTPAWLQAADAASLAEIRQYFELRDTISLVNLEMKRALVPDGKSSMLTDSRAENDLNAVLDFLEKRIEQFAAVKTPLKYHYVKKLGGLFRESRQLQASLLVKLRANKLAAAPDSTLNRPQTPQELLSDLKKHPRPYFHPVDFRTLVSPSLEDANKMQFPIASSTKNNVAPPARSDNSADKSLSLTEKPEILPAQSAAKPLPERTLTFAPPVEMSAKTPVLIQPVEIVAPPREISSVKQTSLTTAVREDKPAPVIKPDSTDKSAEQDIIAEPAVADAPDNSAVPESVEPAVPSIPAKVSLPEPARTAVTTAPAKVSMPESAKAVVASSAAKVVSALPMTDDKPVASAAQAFSPATATGEITQSSIGKTVMRPLAVMIENHNKSRPQSGLDQADLVYEIPVEGGITRFMGVYTRIPDLLGPIRSCRDYFIDRALEVSALYVHCGGSPGGYAYISKSRIDSVDEIKHSKPFFRDKSRKAPHNLYGKGSKIVDYMASKIEMKLALAPRLLNYGSYPVDQSEIGTSVKIRYHGNYTLEVKFENGVYQRYMNNVLHIDRETKKPLQASAVVVQVAAMRVIDKAGRQDISFIGSGKAWILENGRKTAVTWSKNKPRTLTSYKDAAGREYLFPKGLPVWVQVVSPSHKLVFNGEEASEPVATGKTSDETASATVKTGKQG